MNGKMTMEELFSLNEEELFERLKDTYYKQKLSKNASKFARISEIIVGLIFFIVAEDFLYKGFALLATGYAIYRFVKPHGEDDEYLKGLKEMSEEFGKYKENRENGKFIEKFGQNKADKIDKNILKTINKFVANDKMYRIIGMIPVANYWNDEMENYRKFLGSWVAEIRNQNAKLEEKN